MTTRVISRRNLLRGAAGITVVAAGGLVWRGWDTGALTGQSGPAYQPWHDWKNAAVSGPLAIVQAGILSANAHNTQPWRFRIEPEAISVFADYARHLGTFDPFRREMTLSLGCAVENMAHAAAAEGYDPAVALAPGRLALGGPVDRDQPVARIKLTRGAVRKTEFYEAIAHRHTHRGAYIPERKLDTALKNEMAALVAAHQADVRIVIIDSDPEMARFGELTVQATEQIITDHEMAMDSARWFRFDRHAVDRHRDGVTIDGFGLPPLLNAAVKMLPPPSAEEADRQWLEATRDVHVATAGLVGFIAVRDLYERTTALQAGRIWQHLHLWATARGLSAQPLNQLPERVDREAQTDAPPTTAAALVELTGDSSWHPTFAFRMGYAESPARPSPRRSLDEVAVG